MAIDSFIFRQIRQARRNGPLRYIIPHPDDLPPPYTNYGPASGGASGSLGGAGLADGQTEGNGNMPAGKSKLENFDGFFQCFQIIRLKMFRFFCERAKNLFFLN